MLKGAAECYFVFDQQAREGEGVVRGVGGTGRAAPPPAARCRPAPTPFKTGIAAIKNPAPYPGLELVTCVLQLDCGPPKASKRREKQGG